MTKTKRATAKIITLRFDDNRLARDLFGAEDSHLKSIEKTLGIDINVRGHDLKLSGQAHDIAIGERVINQLYKLLRKGYPIMGSDIEAAVRLLSRDHGADIESVFSDTIFLPARKRVISPRSVAQKEYVDAIRKHDIVFAVGPAGTGKSYLAVAMAVASFLRKEYERIVLARPAVEAGERLGFLPGDMQQKINPYLRPLYDALYDMMEPERVNALIADDIIEIAPFAFMRGRTLNRAIVIIDEAQNCSYAQMKMCLTRLGPDSKMIVNGDVTQIDLPRGEPSGLVEAWRILRGLSDIGFCELTEADVVRHPLVGEIVSAYKKEEVKNVR